MSTPKASIDIARPPDAVFDFMLDFGHAAEWRELITSMEWVDGGPRVGAAVRMRFWSEGAEQVQDATLVEYDRPRRYVLSHHARGFRARYVNVVEPSTNGARVTIGMELRADTLAGTLLVPLLRWHHGKRLKGVLARLKIAAEKRR